MSSALLCPAADRTAPALVDDVTFVAPTVLIRPAPAVGVSASAAATRLQGIAQRLAALGCALLDGLTDPRVPDVLWLQPQADASLWALARTVAARGGVVLLDLCGGVHGLASIDSVVAQDALVLTDDFAPQPADLPHISAVSASSPLSRRFELAGCWFGSATDLYTALPALDALLGCARVGHVDVFTDHASAARVQGMRPLLRVHAVDDVSATPQRLNGHDFCLVVPLSEDAADDDSRATATLRAALVEGVVPLAMHAPGLAALALRLGQPELVVGCADELLQRLAPGVLNRLRIGLRSARGRAAVEALWPREPLCALLDQVQGVMRTRRAARAARQVLAEAAGRTPAGSARSAP